MEERSALLALFAGFARSADNLAAAVRRRSILGDADLAGREEPVHRGGQIGDGVALGLGHCGHHLRREICQHFSVIDAAPLRSQRIKTGKECGIGGATADSAEHPGRLILGSENTVAPTKLDDLTARRVIGLHGAQFAKVAVGISGLVLALRGQIEPRAHGVIPCRRSGLAGAAVAAGERRVRSEEHGAAHVEGDGTQLADELTRLGPRVFVSSEEVVQAVEHEQLGTGVKHQLSKARVECSPLTRAPLIPKLDEQIVLANAAEQGEVFEVAKAGAIVVGDVP